MGHLAVVKVSGAVFNLGEDPAGSRIAAVAGQLRRAAEGGWRIVAVAGGGEVARMYIRAARALGANEAELDELGIRITRANAELLKAGLRGIVYPRIPETVQELLEASTSQMPLIVMGGLQPGQSTNAVAAIAAEGLGAELLINATDVDGVYSEDPRKNPSARKLSSVYIWELERLLGGSEHRAGTYELLDHVALRILSRSAIPTIVTSYEHILDALSGREVGTRVTYR